MDNINGLLKDKNDNYIKTVLIKMAIKTTV